MTDVPSPAAAPLYMVALPTRTEGPYTIEELRNLLREGHLTPGDLVERVGVLHSATIGELIPDAASIRVSTDRVVRRSGSSARLKKASSDSQVRRYRTPAPAIAEQSAALSEPAGEGGAPLAKRRRPGPAVAALAGVALALGLAALAWESGRFDPPLPVAMVGWTVAFPPAPGAVSTGAGPQGGPWELRIMNGKMVVTAPDHSTSSHAVTPGAVAGGDAEYLLTPPHPQLGVKITVSGADPVVIEAAGAHGRGHGLSASDAL